MPGFDAEFYLRCAAEDSLPTCDLAGVSDRARALAAVGALTWDTAKAVLHEYGRAYVARGAHDESAVDRSTAARPETRRVSRCAGTIDQPWGTVRLRYIAFGERRTEIAAVVDLKPDAEPPAVPSSVGRRDLRRHHFIHRGPPDIRVTDDRGRVGEATFGGNASDYHWQGNWTLEPGLTRDASWIELLDVRVELSDITAPIEVRVSNLADATPTERAERHLDHRLETLGVRRRDADPIEAVIDTLVACGALAPDSPIIARTRVIADALTTGNVSASIDLPPRWQSVLRPPHRRQEPDRSMLLGATVSDLDGQDLTIMVLDVTGNCFGFEFTGVGALAANFDQSNLDAVLLTFAATDDRGNHYLGQLGSHGHSGAEIEGSVTFTPALDPDATRLDLVLATDRALATIRVLLQWEERG
jgi:hypothetical protein